MKNIHCNRRQLLRYALLSTAAIPAGSLLLSTPTLAQDKPKRTRLSEDTPGAIKLGYKHDTNEVDDSVYTRHKVSQRCKNCRISRGPKEEWRGCGRFPGKLVNANGWCKSWTGRSK